MRELKILLLLTGLLLLPVNSSMLFSQHPSHGYTIQSSGFDVLVLNNGTIIHGRVMEVGLDIIKYKRTDIPDGPIYEIEKGMVFAISYRNQLTEYLKTDTLTIFRERQPDITTIPTITDDIEEPIERWYDSADKGEVRAGLGFIRIYSRVKEIDQYLTELSFPAINIAYLFPFNENIDLGIAVSMATFNYADKSFSEYDQIMSDRSIKESLFMTAVVGKYSFDMNAIKPYILGGISYTNSSVKTEGVITFTDDERSIIVQGGARSGKIGVPIRVGVDVSIAESFGAYVDFGTGISLLQIGGIIKLK